MERKKQNKRNKQSTPRTNSQLVGKPDDGRTLGIVSLVFSVIGLGLVGIILGIIAIRKSKKSGHGINACGLVGVIYGAISVWAVLMILGGLSTSG